MWPNRGEKVRQAQEEIHVGRTPAGREVHVRAGARPRLLAVAALRPIHHLLVTHSLTYTQTRAYTRWSLCTRKCWYTLIRALNTRLDASETHLSPCKCVELKRCVCESECDPPSFRSKQSTGEWLAANLIDSQTTSSRLSAPRSFIVHHPFSFLPHYPPSPRTHRHTHALQQPFCSPCAPFPSLARAAARLFAFRPPTCLTPNVVNTSLCRRLDRITCACGSPPPTTMRALCHLEPYGISMHA